MNLPLPSANEILSSSRGSTREVLSIWDRTTKTLKRNIADAKQAMSAYQSGQLHNADKFSCNFFSITNAKSDTMQIFFKVGGQRLDLDSNGSKALKVNGDTAAKTIDQWESYIENLKIDQDDFAKLIHKTAIEKAKPKVKDPDTGKRKNSTYDKNADVWIMD